MGETNGVNAVAQEIITQNLKLLKIMKATGYKDSEIATTIGVKTKDFLDVVENDDYIKDIMEHAQNKLATEVERKFVEKMMEKLDDGDSKDAMFYLERTVPKYSRKDKVDVSGSVSIDEIILEHGGKVGNKNGE